MDVHVLAGGAYEMGKAHGSIDPEYARNRLQAVMKRWPPDFSDPYITGNIRFMKREFPSLIEQIRGYGESVGLESFEHAYLLHIFKTGGSGCSAFGINLADDGPAMLRTYDPDTLEGAERYILERMLIVCPDLKPHGFLGATSKAHSTVHTSLNDSGLLIGSATGRPKFTWPDKHEHVNLFFTAHLLSQFCADCDDVRHFLKQYRISGIKGLNGVAVDAKGGMLGFELESENIAFREPEEGMVLEVNHWQDPELQSLGRKMAPDLWQSPYYYNSQNRIQHLQCYRNEYKSMKSIGDLIEFSFETQEPGRILQFDGFNIGNWSTSHALFMTSRDRTARIFQYPLEKDRSTTVRYPTGEVIP